VFLAFSGSTLLHGAGAGVIIYLLLTFPHIWMLEVQQGEAIVIHAQMSAVAATAPEQVTEVEVSIETAPLTPPPPVAVEHTPITDTLVPVPASIPVVRNGEYEPTEIPPQLQPPQSPANVAIETKTPPREKVEKEVQPIEEKASKMPERQIADIVRDSPSKINVAASRPTVAGAVDEMPRKLASNRIPYYPAEALRAGIEGRVILRVQISPEGRASQIELETSSGFVSFDQSAIDAVRDWRFAPAKRKGLAVQHEVLIPVRFRINRG
jgi:protein TonB